MGQGWRQPQAPTTSPGPTGAPLALPGRWEHLEDQEKELVIESCTILTTAANQEVVPLHGRMPSVLVPEDFDILLDPEERRLDNLKNVLHPAATGTLVRHPVSAYVNKTTNEGKECIEPVSPPAP